VVSGPADARGLVVASLSGFAQLIQQAGTPAESSSIPPTTPPTMEAFSQISQQQGDELVGPSHVPDFYLVGNGQGSVPPRLPLAVDGCGQAALKMQLQNTIYFFLS
jgi:hypothetical protein